MRNVRPCIAVVGVSRAAPRKVAESFYLSPEWRALVDDIIRERGRRCEDSACETPNGPWSRIIGDHIIERRDGGAPLDKRNVLLRCQACHARKTARERARRMLNKTG